MQVGFIGIGVIGRPMTLNLLKAEHHVTVYVRHPDKPGVQEVLNSGAKLAPSPRAVAMAPLSIGSRRELLGLTLDHGVTPPPVLAHQD